MINWSEYNDRRIIPLPLENCRLRIVIKDWKDNKQEYMEIVGNWEPYNGKYSTKINDTLPNKGYLGTLYHLTENNIKIGYNAWQQNSSEFIFYKILK